MLQPIEKLWAMDAERVQALFAAARAGQAASLSPGYMGGRRAGYQVEDGTAIIELSGTLTKGGDYNYGTSMKDVEAQVNAAAADPAVRSILLLVNSPGGTAAGTYELANAVYKARQTKTVVAFVEDMGASAAYWIASQASKVYANGPALVGSIGTFAVVFDESKLYQNAGVTVHVIRAGDQKGVGTPGAPIPPEFLAELQKIVNGINAFFLEAVTRGRGLAGAPLAAVADGRVFLAAEAQKLRLIDGVQDLATTMAGMKAGAVGRATSAKSAAPITNDVQQFEAAIQAELKAGAGTRNAAATAAAKKHRDLHAAYLKATNRRSQAL